MRKIISAVVLAVLAGCFSAPAQSPSPDSELLPKAIELFESSRYRPAQEELQKIRLATDDNSEQAVRVDYMLSVCAARLGQRNSMEMLRSFLLKYPNSIYSNDIRFEVANTYYADGNYSRARQELLSVGRFELPAGLRDEYSFKLGYSYFMGEYYRDAYNNFHQVSYGEYYPHAKYYMAYIDYVEGNYRAAKAGFTELAGHEAYSKIIPFYMLQLEFLEGNYDYVVANGDNLMGISTGQRAAEIARVVSESWFHKKDYRKAIHYMDEYRAYGGKMERSENYILGYSHYEMNDMDWALRSLSQVVGPDDKLTQNAAYHLAGAYLRTGDKRDAMRSFSVAAALDFDPAIKEDAMFNTAKLQFELGGGVFNEAVNVLLRYISEYPDSQRVDEAREYLAAAYYNSRDFDRAYETIILIPNPDNNTRSALQKITYFRALDHYSRGDMDKAYSLLEESLKNRQTPKYTALTQFWKAEILFRKGKFREAIPLYQEYISLSPAAEREHRLAEYNLGYCYFNQKQWSEAMNWFDRFVKNYGREDSYLANAYNRLGDISYSRREFRTAEDYYGRAMSAGLDNPEMYYAQFQRAMMMGFNGRRDSKISELRNIINNRRGYVSDAMYELGQTYLQTERFNDAATYFRQFVDTYPSEDRYLAALSELGLIYQNLGDNQNALRYYKMVVDKAPNSREAQAAILSVRSLYVDMNDVDGYFNFARSSGIETDLSTVARDSLSYASAERVYLSGARTSAISSFNDYLNKYPRGLYRANAYYYLGESYLAEGRRNEAVSAFASLSDMHYNTFTVRGLERLAPMLYEDGRFGESAEAYYKLATTSVNPQTASQAYSRYLGSVKQTGDNQRLLEAAEAVIASGNASTDVRREALYLKGEAAEALGRTEESFIIFRDLATEANSYAGAASMLKMAEWYYDRKAYSDAEQYVLRMAEQNTPHTYLLGKAFLILGDSYVARGDLFQARATLQSIVDGYSPANDGIVAAARERLEKL